MESIGLVGYFSAAVIIAIFGILVFFARNKTFIARWLMLSIVAFFAANAIAALQVNFSFSLVWVILVDAIKIGCWALLIIALNYQLESLRTLLSHRLSVAYLAFLALALVTWYCVNLFFGASYNFLFFLFTLFNLITLVLLEQFYRNSPDSARWTIWPFIIGIASFSLFDFVLYAQASMLNSISFEYWYSRGFIACLCVPFMLVGARRIQNGTVRVFVSRQVVFYSSMLMIAGVYLLVMAFAGYIIRFLGGEWGGLVSVTFLMFASIVLVVLLVTETLRRKVKVFIAKNFFANKYEYRDEWLSLIEKIETTSAESYYQMATEIMIAKLEAAGGAILKWQGSHQYQVKYSKGIALGDELEQGLNLCGQFCQQQGWIVDLSEYSRTPNLYHGLYLTSSFYQSSQVNTIVPIFIGKAFYGLFVIGPSAEAKQLNWEDRDLLFAVSKQLGNFISLHEANDKLAESKQFDAFNRMSAFLVHDLKNVQAQLSLINMNAKKHRDNPAFVDDVFETVESATERLDKMLKQLRNKQLAESQSKEIDLAELIDKVVTQCNIRAPQVIIEQIQSCVLAIDGETLHSVLHHLLQNAQEATASDGWVKISLKAQSEYAVIEISDNGSGMSQEFIEKRLFKPFDTTKGNAGMGIGVYEAKQFVEGLAGSIDVTSEPDVGTRFVLSLPKKNKIDEVLI